jgi:DNA-binding SARP family transcriptional activator
VNGVHLTIVGAFGVRRGDHTAPGNDVGSRKARILLALLAVEPHRLTGIDPIAEALWTEPPRRPVQDVATIVSRLRAVLGRECVTGGRIGYRLGEGVRVDLYDAVDHLETAVRLLRAGDDPPALAAAVRAMLVLQSGGVLDDMPAADWAEPARQVHTISLRRVRHIAAEAALRTADVDLAQRVATAARRADPFDEAACRLAMRAHVAAAEPARAVPEYEALRVSLAEDLGVDPAAETRALRVALLGGAEAGATRSGRRCRGCCDGPATRTVRPAWAAPRRMPARPAGR